MTSWDWRETRPDTMAAERERDGTRVRLVASEAWGGGARASVWLTVPGSPGVRVVEVPAPDLAHARLLAEFHAWSLARGLTRIVEAA